MTRSTLAIVDFPEPERPVKEDGQPLGVPGWVTLSQLRRHIGEGEPLRNVLAERQPIPQLGTRDVKRARALSHFVDRRVAILLLDVDHELEGHHGDAELLLILLEQLLSIVGTIERVAARIASGACMVTADDEVRAPVVLADDRVPDRFARPSHPHRQREE